MPVGGGCMKNRESIWITGVGAGTPLGWDFTSVAQNLLAGKSAVRTVDSFDITQHPTQIAASLDPIPCPDGYDAEQFKKWSRLQRLSLWCGMQTLRDAGLWDQRREMRIG